MNVLKKFKRKMYSKSGGGPNFGNRCPDYDDRCVICSAWRYYDIYDGFPSAFESFDRWRDLHPHLLQSPFGHVILGCGYESETFSHTLSRDLL